MMYETTHYMMLETSMFLFMVIGFVYLSV